ncbi:MAG: GNAT family protein [Planctomycetaceae bacterium]
MNTLAVPDIRLRPYQSDDVDRLFEAARESVIHMSPWMPWCHAEYSRGEAEVWVEGNCGKTGTNEGHIFVIEGADGRFLGGCGLNRVDTMHRYANLGYWLRRTALRQGIATAAVRLLRDYAFARTILDRLEIIVAVQNTASQRVAERVGAVREGKLREALLLHGQRHDAVLYSLLRSDPR